MTAPRPAQRWEISWGCLPIIVIAAAIWAGIATGCLVVVR